LFGSVEQLLKTSTELLVAMEAAQASAAPGALAQQLARLLGSAADEPLLLCVATISVQHPLPWLSTGQASDVHINLCGVHALLYPQ
jgi:hypothetical protein